MWVLHDGSIQQWDERGNLLVNASASKFERLKTFFRRMELKSSMRPIDVETSDVEISYLSSKDLKTQYQRQPEHRHLAVKLHHHFAFPFSHIILLFLGLPFVLHFENRSVFLSLISCFVICALFFVVSSISMNIANQSELFSPILAAWLPVMLFGSLGITLFDHLPT
jgi:lipopolysaccharide export LptBFGC system permease protein LptF